MAQSLGNLYLGISGDSKPLRRDLAQAERMVKSSGTAMTREFSLIKRAMGAIGAYVTFRTLSAQMYGAVRAASDLQETTGKFNVVFKGVEGQAEEMVEQLTTGYAMSTEEARRHLAAVQDLLKPLGIATDDAADLSGEIVELAADLGSFNNLSTADVLRDLQSALVGNHETVQKYGVVLNQATVKQKALEMGLADTKDELTTTELVMARYKLILEGTTDAQGDAKRSTGTLAKAQKELSARVSDLQAAVGAALLPYVTDLVIELGGWVGENEDLIAQDVKGWVEGTADVVVDLVAVFGRVAAAVDVVVGFLEGVQKVQLDIASLLGLQGAEAFMDAWADSFARPEWSTNPMNNLVDMEALERMGSEAAGAFQGISDELMVAHDSATKMTTAYGNMAAAAETAGQQASDAVRDADEATAGLTEATDETTRSAEDLGAATEDTTSSAEELAETVSESNAAASEGLNQIIELEALRAEKVLAATERYREMSEALTAAMEIELERIAAASEALETHFGRVAELGAEMIENEQERSEDYLEIWTETWVGIQELTGSALETMFADAISRFREMTAQMLDAWLDMVSEMEAAWNSMNLETPDADAPDSDDDDTDYVEVREDDPNLRAKTARRMIRAAGGALFYGSGGWLGSHPAGGMISGGSGVRDDVYLGHNAFGMAREFVVNQEATRKNLALLQWMNDGRVDVLAELGGSRGLSSGGHVGGSAGSPAGSAAVRDPLPRKMVLKVGEREFDAYIDYRSEKRADSVVARREKRGVLAGTRMVY